MNGEKETIELILSHFRASGGHLNRFFESDAEVLEPGPGKLLFTADEFSAEDLFPEDDPWLLGWNLACCTISDVLASGGDALYYAHALTLSASWDRDYISRFSRGIADALEKAGAGFIGGDLGSASSWKYTGICLGSASRPLTRRGARPGDGIFMTGEVGAGNLMAARSLFAGHLPPQGAMPASGTRMPLRAAESKVVRTYAGCCIDTSDGVLNALNAIAEINGTGYTVSDLPYLPEGLVAMNRIGRRKTFLFAGECGEYELLFTLGRDREEDFLREARAASLQFAYLGRVTETPDRLLLEDGKWLKFNDFNISARGYGHLEDYLNDLTNYIDHASGTG